MSGRALLFGIDPAGARTLRFRDRLIAAGVPLVVLPLLAMSAWLLLQPPGNSPGAFLAIPAYGIFVTLPALPVVVLVSYWFSRRGLLGLLPFAAAGAGFGLLAVGIALFAASFEAPVRAADIAPVLLSWTFVGALYAGAAWLTLVILRIDLYFPETRS